MGAVLGGLSIKIRAVHMMCSANIEYDTHVGWPRQLHIFIIGHLELTIEMPMSISYQEIFEIELGGGLSGRQIEFEQRLWCTRANMGMIYTWRLPWAIAYIHNWMYEYLKLTTFDKYPWQISGMKKRANAAFREREKFVKQNSAWIYVVSPSQ